MAHIFLNVLIAHLYQDFTFKHIAFIGNRYLPVVVNSRFSRFVSPIFHDVSGLTISKCSFQNAASSVIDIQEKDFEYEKEL